MSNLCEFRIESFAKGKMPKQMLFCSSTEVAEVDVIPKAQRLMSVKHILNKKLICYKSLSRTGFAFLALSQEQGIILKLLFRSRTGSSFWVPAHTPTLKFGEYSPGCNH